MADIPFTSLKGGFQDVRLNILDNPLTHLFAKNSLVDKLDGALVWERRSPATYIDRYGILRYASSHEPRQEEEGWLVEGAQTNLIVQSGDLTDINYWFNGDLVTTDGTLAPDGTSQAFLIPDNSGNVGLNVRQTVNLVDNGSTITMSWFAKQGTAPTARVRWIATSGDTVDVSAVFDFASETFISGLSYSPTFKRLDNGWYRLSITHSQQNIGTAQMRLDIAAGAATGQTGTIYAWGAQMEVHSNTSQGLSSYIPTELSSVTRATEEMYADLYGSMPSTKDSFSIVLTTNASTPALAGSYHYVWGLAKADNTTSNVAMMARRATNGNISGSGMKVMELIEPYQCKGLICHQMGILTQLPAP